MGNDDDPTLANDSTKSIRTFVSNEQLQATKGKDVMKMILFFALGIFFGVVIIPSVDNTSVVLRGGNRITAFIDTDSIPSSSSSLANPECLAKIHRLEKVWNERRQVRMNILMEAKKANKNIYDYLWRVQLPEKSDPTYVQRKQIDANRKVRYSFDLFEPEAVCLTEERFGGRSERYNAFGDGPKFACGVDYMHELYKGKEGTDDNCLVYSIGSNNQIQFEIAVKKQIGCEIHTFDPTLNSPFVGGQYAEFHPWGLGKDGVHVEFRDTKFVTKSVDRIIKELGHVNRTIDIFKIDCERCEYDAMPPVFEAIARGQLQIHQILIELHRTPNSYEVLADFFEAADKAGYRITHKERNHWGCMGYSCIEYAFVSEDFLRRATAAAIC
jgi:hypothetical protein